MSVCAALRSSGPHQAAFVYSIGARFARFPGTGSRFGALRARRSPFPGTGSRFGALGACRSPFPGTGSRFGALRARRSPFPGTGTPRPSSHAPSPRASTWPRRPLAYSPRVATITALMVCIRFSASSKTMLAGLSKTSSVTSTPSRPNLAWTSRPTCVSRLW